MTPSDDSILLQLYRIQHEIFELTESIKKYRIKEAILLDEAKARNIDLDKEMQPALSRFLESF